MYVGDFHNGFRHGSGTYTYLHGTRIYEGEWKWSRRHGKGKDTWRRQQQCLKKDGSSSTATIQTTSKSTCNSGGGDGTMVLWSYEGEFRNDVMHGYGIEHKGSTVYAGEFVAGLKEGRGRMVWSNGNVYDGQWQRGRMSGEGKYASMKHCSRV